MTMYFTKTGVLLLSISFAGVICASPLIRSISVVPSRPYFALTGRGLLAC